MREDRNHRFGGLISPGTIANRINVTLLRPTELRVKILSVAQNNLLLL